MRDTFTPPDLKIGGRGVLTGLKAGDVAKYVLLVVRDPLGYDRDAADEIATYLDDADLLADTGLFRTFSGSYKGVRVTVCSTGSGAPDTELALVDLAELSPAGVFIRVGTSGSANDRVRVGDLVIASGAVRSDGASREYVDAGYPAVASPEVTLALAEAATRLGHSHHVGITRSNDSLYAGQGRPVLGYFVPGSEGVATRWARANVLNFERETSLILTLCNLFDRRGGAVNAVVNSAISEEVAPGSGVAASIEVTLEALLLLERRDRIKAAAGQSFWTPALGDEDEATGGSDG
jgi:uridine phosphorylase